MRLLNRGRTYGPANNGVRETHSIRQCRASPRARLRETPAESGAGGHVGGEDVVGVAVQVLAGPVVPHGGARVGVPGGDLHIAQVDASIEHGRDCAVCRSM